MTNRHPALARALALQAKFNANAPQIIAPVAQPVVVPGIAQLESPEIELLTADFLIVAPDMLPTIETLRGLLVKFMSGGLCTHDCGAIDDAIARSGFLLQRADGKDTTSAVAAYEASLLEGPDADEADTDDDFGRYGCDD